METCKECNRDFESIEFIFRHMRSHGITAQDYILKWNHGGNIPVCACGCGKNTTWNIGMKNFTKYIKGHSAKGRKKSDDEKRRIGEKNSVNMKRWMSRHPDIAKRKSELMLSHRTPEVEEHRIASTKSAYASMTEEEKQKFSDHTKRLWDNGILADAREKAAETYKQRYADGLYDFTERNDKISAAITQRYLDGGFEWSTGQYTSTKTGAVCNYRSSWELELMQILDTDDRIESWRYEPISIPYVFAGKTRRYVPDFHAVTASGSDLLVEVKPPTLTGTETNTSKRQSALDFCSRNGWKYVEWSKGDELLKTTLTFHHHEGEVML